MSMLSAQWIWKHQTSYKAYNKTVLFCKAFHQESLPAQARLCITADSWYRLFVNGEWVNDGPCRSWPEHYQYDEIDLTPYLHAGQNELQAIAKYWGTGTFHTVPQQAGFWAQLELTQVEGEKRIIATDETWQAVDLPAWLSNTPKVSIQMEPQEYYDARLEAEPLYEPAVVLFDKQSAPWKDLHPRDVPLLTRLPVPLGSPISIQQLRKPKGWHFCLPAARLVYPELIEANRNVLLVGGLASLLKLSQGAEVRFQEAGVTVFIDGEQHKDGTYTLEAGEHWVLVFITQPLGHNKDKDFHIYLPPGRELRLENPVDPAQPNPWCWLDFSEFACALDDLHWPEQSLPGAFAEKQAQYLGLIEELGRQVASRGAFRAALGSRVRQLAIDELFALDTHWRLLNRQVMGEAADQVRSVPEGWLIQPSAEKDIELIFDLGEQDIGYYQFELEAEAGVELDIYGVEYISPEGVVQHTGGNRNGLTFITRQGINHFTSTKRRSGRYLFLTFHNQKSPVILRSLQVIESTYPVQPVGSFHCSDERLDRIWEISARTLKLCMEDTFTDCPLYEQTLWVGDARNESAFAYPVFGAADIGKRCIILAGQSLESYPIAGCQVPSSWDTLLPAWSFLWGISVWDYYFFSKDKVFLQSAWSWVLSNLRGAESLCTDQGLFSGAFWNMFDWAGIDDGHRTVLHNSMLLVGAIEAALKCAAVLEDETQAKWLREFKDRLCNRLNRLWDPARKSYPDSLLEDGTPSPSTCQHTSFLALLYDICTSSQRPGALANVLHPPKEMVRVGSPFAMMYLYELLEKEGLPEAILQSIYDSYLPMLEVGATTVWEVFPSSEARPGGFPTRSHCHAWSSAPLYFLPRVVLGLRQLEPGGTAFEISPHLCSMTWAEGTIATAQGPVHATWRKEGDTLHISYAAPAGVSVKIVENESLKGLRII
jgi:alpha-L-rhamnosidase